MIFVTWYISAPAAYVSNVNLTGRSDLPEITDGLGCGVWDTDDAEGTATLDCPGRLSGRYVYLVAKHIATKEVYIYGTLGAHDTGKGYYNMASRVISLYDIFFSREVANINRAQNVIICARAEIIDKGCKSQ